MIAKEIGTGHGIVGLFTYNAHDQVTAENPRPTTSERVAWIATLESPTDDAQLTMRIMQGVVADASILKRRAGGSSKGRKLRYPYVHHVFSWRPGEHPTMETKLAAVREGLKAVGLDDRITIAVAHHDTDHEHVHTMTCRVHPYTGLAAKLSHSQKKLQTWSEDYERRHGGIQVPARVERRKERAAFEAAVAEEMKDFEPTARTLWQQQRQQAEARRAAKRRVRATGRYRLTPVQPPRGPGGAARTPTDWNPREQTAFNKLYRRQRNDGTDRPTAAAERRKLRTRLDRNRRLPTSGLLDAIRKEWGKEWGDLREGLGALRKEWGNPFVGIRAHRARKARHAEWDREDARRAADQRRAERFGANATPSTAIQPETITPDPPPPSDLVPEPAADTRDTATPPPRSADLPLKRLTPGVAGPQRSGVKPKSTAPPTKRRTTPEM